jgi:hypothetical protein
MVAAAEYDLKKQEQGNLIDASKKDYIVATREGERFSLKNIIGVVRVVDNKYSFTQINTRYLGTHNNMDVVYFDNIRRVAIGNLNSMYYIDWQIYQNAGDNRFTRYYLVYNGDSKPDANFYSKEDGYKQNDYKPKNYHPNGWLDFYSKTDVKFGTKSTTKNTGLNYFASYYIGTNNPQYNKIDNFDLDPQDAVDAAARDHDIGYSKQGINGKAGVFATTKGQECDYILADVCKNIKGETVSLLDYADDLVNSNTIYDYKTTKERAELIYYLFSKVSTGKLMVKGDVPALIDFSASATKTGLGFATTATTGFFATAGAELLAVPVLSVAAVNLLQTEAKCLYSFIKNDAPAHCYSTKGIILHAWDIEAAKEMILGAGPAVAGKIMTNSLRTINVGPIKIGNASFHNGQVVSQSMTTLASLLSTQSKDEK